MNPFFAYLIKSSICLAVLYCLFRFNMRNDRNHTLNRFLLLGILIVSAIIPFLNIQFFYEEIPVKPVEVVRDFISVPLASESLSHTDTDPAVTQTSALQINWWLLFYLGVIAILLVRIVYGIIHVTQIIKGAQKRRLQNIILALVKDLIQPFTFLNKVVLSEKDFNENKNIIVAHEHAHIKHLHAIDLMVCEVFTVMHFFNPFMWLLRRDLKLIHEFQADQAVLNKGIDAKKYQLLVLQKAVGERRFAMANHFTQKPILKRIKMMQQKNRKQWAALKLILFVPMLVLLLQAFARPELITSANDFIPVKYTENKSEQWLLKWNADNIGKGFYEPELHNIDAPRKGNNVLVILMNARNEYLIENEYPADKSVKQIVKDYLHGINPDGKNGPDFIETEIPEIGKIKVSKGMISYRYDITSSKEMVNKTLRDIGEACLEVRQEKAKLFFDEDYLELTNEKREAIDKAVPVWFTTENPKGPTPSVWLPFDGKPSPEPKPIQIKVKSNGEVFVGDYRYESVESFQENVEGWKEDLAKFNERKRSKGFYRAHVTYDAEFARDKQEELNFFLYKNDVHVEWIKAERTKRMPLQNERLLERNEKTKGASEKMKTSVNSYNNVLEIRINSENEYRIGTRTIVAHSGVDEIVEQFLGGKHPNSEVGPEFELKKIEGVGEIEICKGKIIVAYEDGTPDNLLNHLKKRVDNGYKKARNKKAQELWGKDYVSLSADKKSIINEVVPKLISVKAVNANFSEYSYLSKNVSSNVPDIDKNSAVPVNENDAISGAGDKLFIPNGISPNNDGIHDYFIIKGIYPQFPDAKLLVFNSKGQKVFEKDNYGNTHVWGKDNVWWSGDSNTKTYVESDGKLPAGNYDYVLELGNGEKNNGTILLAKSPENENIVEEVPPIHIKIVENGKLFWGEPNAPYTGNNKGYYVWKDQLTLQQFQEKVRARKVTWSKENPTKELTAFVLIEKNASKVDLANVKSILEREKIYKISYSGESNVLPLVMIHKNWVSYNWRTCNLDDLYNEVKAGVKNRQSKSVEVQVYKETPNEKVELVYSELNKIPNLKIIRNKVSPPPPPPPKVVEVL